MTTWKALCSLAACPAADPDPRRAKDEHRYPIPIQITANHPKSGDIMPTNSGILRVAGIRGYRRGHCCIEAKGVLATAQSSKTGSQAPGNHDKPGIRACCVTSGRVRVAISGGPIAECNSAAQVHAWLGRGRAPKSLRSSVGARTLFEALCRARTAPIVIIDISSDACYPSANDANDVECPAPPAAYSYPFSARCCRVFIALDAR